jgi:hypothetical protein
LALLARCRIAFSLILALAMILTSTSATWAAPGSPVITTPTPNPTATPVIPNARQVLAATPEAERHGAFAFFPLGARNAVPAREVAPDAFAYVAQPGDTLWSLAMDFGRDLDTMSCATTRTGSVPESLIPGQILYVPSLADLCYTVTPGDTLASIAALHGLSIESIVAVSWNGFTTPPYTVRPQQRVLLPGARPQARPRSEPRVVSHADDAWALGPYPEWPFGDGEFIWPVTGAISQGARPGHWAIDIAVDTGTEVKAADRGKVVLAGWSQSGYGFRVVIDHGNDYVTLYAHLSDIFVTAGQVVGKGQTLGLSGANGNVTGPHLHFELRDFGMLTNPLNLLPK